MGFAHYGRNRATSGRGPTVSPAHAARPSDAGIDEFGVICRPNRADLAPDAIYDRLKAGAAGAR